MQSRYLFLAKKRDPCSAISLAVCPAHAYTLCTVCAHALQGDTQYIKCMPMLCKGNRCARYVTSARQVVKACSAWCSRTPWFDSSLSCPPCRIMPRPATLEELLLRQLRDFAESSGLADVVPVEATLASAELLQMGVEQAEETKLKLQVVARLGLGPTILSILWASEC